MGQVCYYRRVGRVDKKETIFEIMAHLQVLAQKDLVHRFIIWYLLGWCVVLYCKYLRLASRPYSACIETHDSQSENCFILIPLSWV